MLPDAVLPSNIEVTTPSGRGGLTSDIFDLLLYGRGCSSVFDATDLLWGGFVNSHCIAILYILVFFYS